MFFGRNFFYWKILLSKNILVENFLIEKFVFLRKKNVLKNSLALQIFGPKNFSVFWAIEDRINPKECEGKWPPPP